MAFKISHRSKSSSLSSGTISVVSDVIKCGLVLGTCTDVGSGVLGSR